MGILSGKGRGSEKAGNSLTVPDGGKNELSKDTLNVDQP